MISKIEMFQDSVSKSIETKMSDAIQLMQKIKANIKVDLKPMTNEIATLLKDHINAITKQITTINQEKQNEEKQSLIKQLEEANQQAEHSVDTLNTVSKQKKILEQSLNELEIEKKQNLVRIIFEFCYCYQQKANNNRMYSKQLKVYSTV